MGGDCKRGWTRAWLLGLLLGTTAASSAAADDEAVEFNRDVRPILSDRCFACHGPDVATREAGLRLDDPTGVTEDRGGYAVVVPGEAGESELIRRLTSEDVGERMPPEEFGKPLSADEIAVMERWIEQGAAWDEHWSLTPLRRPAVPAVAEDQSGARAARSEHVIDAFIDRQLRDEGLERSPPADRRTLARRLAFDLTGLPPAPELVERFLADESADAYPRLVDRLLRSPHYGERMAMYWLDLVRYADTLGYHGDQIRSVSPYRDYVIAAFNENLPFDQFTIENLAGDLLPEATLQQRVASTYNRLNRASAEGGVQPKEYLAKYAADRVRTTSAVWLGLTLGCAECHDHKFDPLTAKDFYSFAAFFADIKEQGIVGGANHVEQLPVPSPGQQREQQRLDAAIAEAEEAFAARTPELEEAFAAWQQEIAAGSGRWQPLRITEAASAQGATLEVAEDGSVRATGNSPDRDQYTLRGAVDLEQFGALRLEVLPDPSLPSDGPGRAGNGNFVVNRIEVAAGGQPVAWSAAAASHHQNRHPAKNLLGDDTPGWAILPETGRAHQLALTAAEPKPLGAEDGERTITVTISQNHGSRHTLGRFRLYVAAEADRVEPAALVDADLERIAATPAAQRDEQDEARLREAFREQTPLLAEVRRRLEELRGARERLQRAIPTTLVSKSVEPREMRVLPRGNWMDDSGPVVDPAVPAVLPGPRAEPGERLTRLDLARWMVAPENPLVARTFVNRLWMLMFGHGLSRSVDDLGSQGEAPTHPELLDWLAAEFIDSGWDTKHLVRLLVTSETYRQRSDAPPELARRDPDNRWFARQSRWRLDAEMVRDNALSVSGLLVPDIGGKSVFPYQPAGYWGQLNFPKRTYEHDSGPSQYRRGVYTHWQRTFLHPSLLAFDASPREECTARRDRSNTPLQALVLLNDPSFVEAARVFAAEIVRSGGEDFSERLAWTYRRALARRPSPRETELLRALYDENFAVYQADADAAERLLATGEYPVPDDLDRTELAAWTSVARAMLNLHESINRY